MAATKARTKRAPANRYTLPARLELAQLAPVHAALMQYTSGKGDFVLDGGELSVIDTGGVQLLVSFITTLGAAGRKVSWENFSVQAYQMANELGLGDALGD